MRRLRRFLQLTAAEQQLLVKAVLLLCAAKVGLVLLPFQTLRRLMDKLARVRLKSPKTERESAGKVAWAVELAGRLVPWATTCLTQGLVAQVLLVRRGRPASLHVGVVKDAERFLAHAWLESEGKVVIGAHELDRYTLLTTLEAKVDG